MEEHKMIKLIYSDLDTKIKLQEALLEQKLNSEVSLTTSEEAIKILYEIAILKTSVTTLNNYLGV